MRKLFYFLAFLFIACVACDSKDEPKTPPALPEPPAPISPKDSIYNMLSGYWNIDSVETFNYGVKASAVFEYVLIGYSKVKYSGNEHLQLRGGNLFRKENNQDDYYHTGGRYGMRGDTAFVESYEIISTFQWISYHHSNSRARIYKTEIKRGMYYKDSIISVHRKTKNLPKKYMIISSEK